MEPLNHPVQLSIPRPEKSSRLLAFLALLFFIPKVIILIPHLIILWALGILGCIVGILAQFVVLFTGKYPAGMHELVTGTLRWQIRVNAFLFGLRDEYPPFTWKD